MSGSAYVQQLRERLLSVGAQDIQYFDLKQLAEIQARYRNRLRVMIHHYRRWQADYGRERDRIEKVYRAYEGIFVRRQLADSWQLYLTVNRDYHELRRVYLANLRQPPHRRAAS
ncbi:MAG: hypothetical protein HYS17_03920 [Micavibrio aeruginosavorus]|uniref:Uncharacterized protein n=1 Tax=Micavibrio aeruginosavorus TaxID=349221 RepID=A0A7T5R3K6_9BACT|nr:MAG: hypothetical protein HYS17_03920 [Micavibrio aeruginosavorus]